MAMQQAYAHTNKGTLVPGQMIAVNKYTVQVERYLSQGGFAHVYLVRTATPVYNTTHHVLKRIAVPNEAMLTEVKKEVDIMRILKGHPNIVFLIDAAWHRLPDGSFEVFIFMEYCAGGGIIDMMNRRLRERLTEPEILTIFVDVCEGLAAMHALKPPLLHRDLKVENILQSSASSYKLCDFGSATPVQKVPANSQEIRMLEADLNRHTTLQYRAPEMVDVYLRRPIDEKSDVWALGVLLYKLCYYTTPFEEHGPLAILNVQYKIPPYPVYSGQMNALIASMLREFGTQRPSVFEILNHVHKLRGTKSRFTYNIPSREQPLSPRSMQAPPLQAISQNIASPSQPHANALDDLVTFKSQQPLPLSPSKNAGTEARDRVLEAIAPMRRGRPPPSASPVVPTPPASPKKGKFELDMKFSAEEDRAWRGVRGHKSGLASVGMTNVNLNATPGTDAWGLEPRIALKKAPELEAFDNDFSGFGKSFGDYFEPAGSPPVPLTAQPVSIPQPAPSPKPPSASPQTSRFQPARSTKDAFEGLGLTAQLPPQTLGEARKSRTGLASFGLSSSLSANLPATQYLGSGPGTSNTSYRPPSAHSPVPSPFLQQPQSQTLSPDPQPTQSWRQHVRAPSSFMSRGLTPEERFPSVEDLDRTFAPPPAAVSSVGDKIPMAHAQTQPSAANWQPSRASVPGHVRATTDALLGDSGLNVTRAGKGRYDGVRSQHVTGTAMRESRIAARQSMLGRPVEHSRQPEREREAVAPRSGAGLTSRPSIARREKSSVSAKTLDTADLSSVRGDPSLKPSTPTPVLPPRPQPSPRKEPRDWLTGADDDELPPRTPAQQFQPVLRGSPSKRASFIERSPIELAMPLEAENVPEPSYHPRPRKQSKPEKSAGGTGKWDLEKEVEAQMEKDRERERARTKEPKLSRSPRRPTKASVTRTGTGGNIGALGLQLPPVDTNVAAGVTPSPNGLTENWSPVAPSPKPLSKASLSSSSEEGPEDINGFVPRGGSPEKTEEMRKVHEERLTGSSRRRPKSKGRQSSVHDLVDLWGGGVAGEKEEDQENTSGSTSKQTDKRKSVIMPAAGAKPPFLAKPRSESPQPLVDTTTALGRIHLPKSTSPHRRQPSALPVSFALAAPVSAPMAGRSRPQSMFLTSPSKSLTSPSKPLASPSKPLTSPFKPFASPSKPSLVEGVASSSSSAQQTLSPPATPSAKRSMRRSSISDMVQLYEAIGSNQTRGTSAGTGPPAPTVASGPPNVNVATKPAANDTGSTIPSPSAAATRFPKISSDTSPVISKVNLAVPDISGGIGAGREAVRSRPSSTGLPSRTSPTWHLETPYMKSETSNTGTRTEAVNGLPSRRSPLQFPRPLAEEPSDTGVEPPLASPFPERKATIPTATENAVSPGLRSPSPERPYQGVSKLIDRWNRAVDDTSGANASGPRRGGFPARRAGVVGGDSGRGGS
ncbi:predicted protein [Sparassis crispa]|uniref:non-specific serine/threonine protein kinase n=1 Tax=Sparassis crispa TaxID=139825 RepID=A0A401G525_9APHY|nr:predicted protein [Sparassis crispa]GBE77261.1 predicted protein [Sparassis crispa]